MAKQIVMTEDMYENILRDVLEQLRKQKSSDGVFKYSASVGKLEGRRTKLVFSPGAYIKMMELVHGYATEVGWQGTMTRTEDGFLVEDVFVYPQQVNGTQVLTDDGEYNDWLQSLPDEIFNKLRFHGHSHVNFGVFASQTDLNDRQGVVSQLGPEDFYAFVIVNKKQEISCAIFDMRDNVLYETADVDISVSGVDNVFSFKKESEKLVKTRGAVVTPTATQPKKEEYRWLPVEPKTKKSSGKKGKTKKEKDAFWECDEDDDQYSWLGDVYPGYGSEMMK